MTGASGLQTSDLPKPIGPPQSAGKKLPDLRGEIDRPGQRAGPIRLMFQDEARFGRLSDTRRCGCPKPDRPLGRARVTREYTCAHAAVSGADGQLDTLLLPPVKGRCLHLFLDQGASRPLGERIVRVLDGAGGHRSDSLALAPQRRLIKLPPYSPELNPVEHLWDDLRQKSFPNRLFDSWDALENPLAVALRDLELDHRRVHSILAWPWIMASL